MTAKVVWQARTHQAPREKEFNSRMEADECVKELLEMGRQFKAIWTIEPHVEPNK